MAILLAANAAGSSERHDAMAMSGSTTGGGVDPAQAPRTEARLFFSGHSLTNNPLPEFVAAIAEGTGTRAWWNQQNLEGSSIEARTRGTAAPGTGEWAGYRRGRGRDQQAIDVLAELRQPTGNGGQPYDVLVITENHALLDHVIWYDTVRYLRHYHDQFIAANPRATSYLYESWISLPSKDDPTAWIAYEQAASPAWACLGARINHSLTVEGRADRIVPLPVALGLAHLVQLATSAQGVTGLTEATTRRTLDRLFVDDVHLTDLGAYYVALVTYASIYRQSPIGAWAPSDVHPRLAERLQTIAWRFVTRHPDDSRASAPGDCPAYIRDFAGVYLAFKRDAGWLGNNPLWNYAQWARFSIGWRYKLSRSDHRNPLHYDAGTDRAYWLR
jgi:hypothetical protein